MGREKLRWACGCRGNRAIGDKGACRHGRDDGLCGGIGSGYVAAAGSAPVRSSGFGALQMAGIACVVLAALLLAACGLMWKSAASLSPNPKDKPLLSQDAFPAVDWSYWQQVNGDVIGWVSVPGASIEYPVVAASKKDPGFYLDHDVFKRWNPLGVPFLDADCESVEAQVAVIYGHHMDDGSMFSGLQRYLQPEYLAQHGRVLLQTPDKKMELTAVACKRVTAYGTKHINFADEEDFSQWLAGELASADAVDRRALLQSEDGGYGNAVILCTCESPFFGDTRILLFAVGE